MSAIYELLSDAMRERFGGSVTRLAEACGTSTALASRWVHENERKRMIPSPASCEKIALGLRLDPDYVLQLAGHRKPRPGQPASQVQPELDAHLARYGETLSKYPRALRQAIIEANEAMALAIAEIVHPVSDSKEGGVSDAKDAQTRKDHGSDAGLTVLKHHPPNLQRVGAM